MNGAVVETQWCLENSLTWHSFRAFCTDVTSSMRCFFFNLSSWFAIQDFRAWTLFSYSCHISRRPSKNWICIIYIVSVVPPWFCVLFLASFRGFVLTLSLMRPCRICQRRFTAPRRSAKSVLSLRLLSTSWPPIWITDWFTKSTVSCLQLKSTLKPWIRKKCSRFTNMLAHTL